MSNRYRIYFALRGLWYTFLGLGCTRWICEKLHLSSQYHPVGGTNHSLNEIIFDQNDLAEGLLMGDNNT